MKKSVYRPAPADGPKILAVATDLLMTLYALLYAFPHVPSTLVGDVAVDAPGSAADLTRDDVQWFSVRSTNALRAALEALLQTSEVLETSLRPGLTTDAVTRAALADPRTLSDLFDLHLYDAPEVPITCRQMFEGIAAVYRAVNTVEVTTREELWTLCQRYQVIPVGYQLPGKVRVESENRSDLLRFCSELAVDWLQPYFARHAAFYRPAGAAGCPERA